MRHVVIMGDWSPAQRLAIARATGDQLTVKTIADRSVLRALVKRGAADESGTLTTRGRMVRMSIMAAR